MRVYINNTYIYIYMCICTRMYLFVDLFAFVFMYVYIGWDHVFYQGLAGVYHQGKGSDEFKGRISRTPTASTSSCLAGHEGMDLFST